MPKQARHKTKYAGVYWIEGISANGSSERIYYIMYRKGGKLIEEKAGRQYQDDMTPARASGLRAERIAGKKFSNKAERELKEKIKRQKSDRWTIDRLWEEYLNQKPDLKGLVTDKNQYENYKDNLSLVIRNPVS